MYSPLLIPVIVVSLAVGGRSEGPVGYGAGTTGGGSSGGITVTSCSALSAAAGKGGSVIKVQGLLTGCGAIKVGSSTTIQGVGANSGKHHIVLNL
jgi:pectate lyase